MWFLWLTITFFVAIASASQISNAVVNAERPDKVATIVFSTIIAVAWLVISLAIEDIRNYWFALLLGWVLGFLGAGISIKLNKDDYTVSTSAKEWSDMSFNEKRQEARVAVNRAKKDMEAEGIDVDGELEKLCDDFNRQNKLGKYKGAEVVTTQNEAVTEFGPGWREKVCEQLKEIIEEVVQSNSLFKRKIEFSIDEIDLIIEIALMRIEQKPNDFCKKVQETIRERAKNSKHFKGKQTKFSVEDIKTLLNMTFANLSIKENLKVLIKNAESGDVEAQQELAFQYSGGVGVECNHEKEVYWLKKAIEQGSVEAMYSLALDNSQANRHKKEKMLKGISLPAGIPAGKILLFLVRS